MFTQTVEYALRAVVYLAEVHGDERVNSEQIAGTTQVPHAYLSKVLKQLVSHGLIDSTRGARGGFRLVRPADRISVLDVVNAVEPIQRIKTCPLKLRSHTHQLCPLHQRMDQALASLEEQFSRTTIAEILAEPTTSIPLCDFPRVKRRKR